MFIRTNNPNGTTSTASIDGRGRRRENCNVAVCRVTNNAAEIAELRDDITRSEQSAADLRGALTNGSIVVLVKTDDDRYADGTRYTSISLHIINDGNADHRVIRTTDCNVRPENGMYLAHVSRRVNDDATDAELLEMAEFGNVIWREVTSELCRQIDQCESSIDKRNTEIEKLQSQIDNGTADKYEILTAVKDEQAAKRWMSANVYDNDRYTYAIVPTA
jgi:hypothetical protein